MPAGTADELSTAMIAYLHSEGTSGPEALCRLNPRMNLRTQIINLGYR